MKNIQTQLCLKPTWVPVQFVRSLVTNVYLCNKNEIRFLSQNVESTFNRKFFAMRVCVKNVIPCCFAFKKSVYEKCSCMILLYTKCQLRYTVFCKEYQTNSCLFSKWSLVFDKYVFKIQACFSGGYLFVLQSGSDRWLRSGLGQSKCSGQLSCWERRLYV